MQLVAPHKQYFMHFVPLTNVIDFNDAPVAEHLLSILASSYVMFGGLNGTQGGIGAMQKNAKRYGKDVTWKNATQSLLKQKIDQTNMDKIHKEVEASVSLFKYREAGSETRKLDSIRDRIQRVELESMNTDACLEQRGAYVFQLDSNLTVSTSC
jgi:hypothetical protein